MNSNKIILLLKLTRPINFLITAVSVLVGVIICAKVPPSFLIILFAMLSAAFSSAGGNVINDIVDIEIDKISHPERALASNLISKKTAYIFYVLLIAASIVLASMINLNSFILVITANALLLLYSFYLKKIPLIGNLNVSILTGLTFIYGGIVAGNISFAFLPAGFALLINFIREIIKDMQDVEGDSKNGVITFPVKNGFGSAKKIVLIASIVLIVITFVPFIFNFYKIGYFVLVMIIVNPMLVYNIKSLYDNHSNKNLKRLSGILKLAMVFGLAAIYFGK